MPCSLIIYLLWLHRAIVCVSLRHPVKKDKCGAAAVPAAFWDFQLPAVILRKSGTSVKKQNKTKNPTARMGARWERRPRRGLAVSIMEEWAVALAWGFICRVESGAFCRHHAKPVGLHQTPEAYLTLRRFSSVLSAGMVCSRNWSNKEKKCTSRSFSNPCTCLLIKAKRSGWKLLSIVGGSWKQFLAHPIGSRQNRTTKIYKMNHFIQSLQFTFDDTDLVRLTHFFFFISYWFWRLLRMFCCF